MPARLGTSEGRPPAKWLADLRKARVRMHSRGVPSMPAQCCCRYTALTSIPWTNLLQDDAAKGLRAQVTIADIGAISHSYRRHLLWNVSMDHKQQPPNHHTLQCANVCGADSGSSAKEPTTPRSVEACLRLGIDPAELTHIPFETFLRQEHGQGDLANLLYTSAGRLRQVRTYDQPTLVLGAWCKHLTKVCVCGIMPRGIVQCQ